MGDTPVPVENRFTEEQKKQVAEWYNSGKTQEEIGSLLNVPRRTIAKLCTRLGLHKSASEVQKSRRDPLLEQEVVSLRQAGWTLQSIGDKVGLTTSSIDRICNKYNLTVPTSNKKLDDAEVKRLYDSGIGQNKLAGKFDVSAEAIRKSLNRSEATRRPAIIKQTFVKRDITLPPFVDTKEWFENAYIKQHYGMASIASFVGRSTGYVFDRLDYYKIPTRNISDGNRKYDKDHIIDIFKQCNQNISLTARTIGCVPEVVRTVTREAGYAPIDPSIKFIGSGNPFYGQEHTDDTVELCTKIGAENGVKFWKENPEYVNVVKQKTKEYWADPVKRFEDSVNISKLRIQGKCNAKQSVVDSRFGLINCDSSYEANFIEECENNQLIKFVEREFDIVEYEFEGNKHNYVPDFRVWMEDGDFKVVEIKSRYWHENDKHANAKRSAATNKFGNRYEYRLIEKV